MRSKKTVGLINTPTLVLTVILTLNAYQKCEALKCYFCNDHVDYGADNRPYHNCFEGGEPIAQGANRYPVVTCDEMYEDANLCLVKLTFEGKDMKGIKKDCFLRREVDLLGCAEKQGNATRKGNNCVVIKRYDWVNLECGGTRSLEKNRTSDEGVEMNSTEPEVEVAFCTCQGNYCNDEVADKEYKALGITNKYPYGKSGTSANHFRWNVIGTGILILAVISHIY